MNKAEIEAGRAPTDAELLEFVRERESFYAGTRFLEPMYQALAARLARASDAAERSAEDAERR